MEYQRYHEHDYQYNLGVMVIKGHESNVKEILNFYIKE